MCFRHKNKVIAGYHKGWLRHTYVLYQCKECGKYFVYYGITRKFLDLRQEDIDLNDFELLKRDVKLRIWVSILHSTNL